MGFDIDIVVVVGFLIATLIVGLKHGKSVKTIKDYALGGREFSTIALVATIVATYASGSGFFIALSETYSNGFYDFLATMGISVAFFTTSFVLVPRMGEFLGTVSIAEAMGDLYGNKVRVITAVAASIGAAGLIAVQFKVFGSLFSYFMKIPSDFAIILSGIIVTIYSAFGGIRAVTFTDILQGFTFGVIIPMLGFIIWGQFYNSNLSLASAMNDPKFNLNLLFDLSNENLWSCILLFMYFSTPPLSAPIFQRISMGSNIPQVKKAFFIAAIVFIIIQFAITWIPFLIYAVDPDIDSSELLVYIVDTYSFTGLKGLIIVAIIAFAMSTADSFINSSSVLFTNDVYGLFKHNEKKELFVARLFACILGGGTIILSLVETDLLSIIIFANSFYFPLIVPPFFMAIFGFRTTTQPVLIGMFVALVITVAWKFLPEDFLPLAQNVIGFLFSLFCNAVCLIASHYLLRQEGGWVGIKDTSYLDEQRRLRREKWNNCTKYLREFSFKEFRQKIAPESDLTYSALGVYFIICTIATMYSTQVELLGENAPLMRIIYPLMLVTGTSMSMYPIWPLSVATGIKKGIIETWYPIAIFYMLIFFSCFFVLVSKFATIQVLLFSMNLLVTAILLGWRLAIPFIIIGFYFGAKLYQYYFKADYLIEQFMSQEFLLIYMILTIGSVILIFLKPKQEYIYNTEMKVGSLEGEVTDLNEKIVHYDEKIVHYNEKIAEKDQEITRLGATAQKILNNVNHELRLPIGNVVNFSEMLHDGLGKFNEEQLKTLSDEVYKNSTRLSSMILNMLDLATLDVQKVSLNKKKVNFSEIIIDRVKSCSKIYLDNKPIEFRLSIEPDMEISIDPDYMRQVIDNLVINAIKFSQKGDIEIKAQKQNKLIIFTITDEGIGIPQEDLYDIFTPFKMGSNTESKAEGRGVGLALCKSVIKAHDGEIKAESKGIGARFRFVLPNL